MSTDKTPEPTTEPEEKKTPEPPESVLERLSKYLRSVLESLSKSLKDHPAFQILDQLGKLSVIVAVSVFLYGALHRGDERRAQAWQVIYASHGDGGAGVREALTTLYAGGDNLSQINLGKAYLYLPDGGVLCLAGARLAAADCIHTTLSNADLTGACFQNANLDFADLNSADLRGADFRGANLQGTILKYALLEGADLSELQQPLEKKQVESACRVQHITLDASSGIKKEDIGAKVDSDCWWFPKTPTITASSDDACGKPRDRGWWSALLGTSCAVRQTMRPAEQASISSQMGALVSPSSQAPSPPES